MKSSTPLIVGIILSIHAYLYGVAADYELILNQKDAQTTTFSSNVRSTYLENENNPDADTFTNIGNLNQTDFKDNAGYYRLKLIYTNLHLNSVNGADNNLSVTLEWQQTSWITDTNITGYTPINVPTETRAGDNPCSSFKGLGLSSTTTHSFLDGNAYESSCWWNSVGTIRIAAGGIPAFNHYFATAAALYIYTNKTEESFTTTALVDIGESQYLNYTGWVEPETCTIPRSSAILCGAIGTDLLTDDIWLVGGVGTKKSLIAWNGTDFIDRNYPLPVDVYADCGIFYEQIDNILWIYSPQSNRIDQFNLGTQTYRANVKSVPSGHSDNYGRACWTSIIQDDASFLVMMGGYAHWNIFYKETNALNLTSMEWIDTMPDMQYARASVECECVGNTLYAIGGWGAERYDSVEILDVSDMNAVADKNWTVLNITLETNDEHTRSVAYGTDILLLGGRYGDGWGLATDRVYAIDTTTNSLRLAGKMKSPVMQGEVIIVNDVMWWWGGYTLNEAKTGNIKYDCQYLELDALTRSIPTSSDDETCNVEEIGTFSWDTLTEEGLDIPEYDVSAFYVNESDLSLNIQVELEYLGKVYGDDEDEANFGVTYVLDFENYNSHRDAIDKPGTCQNRNEFAFNGSSWEQYWAYSDDPVNDIGTSEYLAYPPPDPASGSWDVYMKDGEECNTVIYEGKFTWNELRGCETNGGGDSYTSVVSNDKWLNLTGTFYINVVSPFWYSSDFGYYRVYQLLSQPFVIAVSSTVYVLGSTGINLMTLSVATVYKEDKESDFKLVLMTETADYMMLERSDASIFLFDPSDDNDNNFDNTDFIASTDPENAEGCLSNKDFICTQLWEINVTNIGCTVGAGGEGTDFSGTYSLGFNAVCINSSEDSHCSQWIESHPDLQGEISLSTQLFWKDEICDPEVFTVQFVANMIFYSGPLSEERSDGSDEYQVIAGNDHLYQVGEDRIYVEIDTEFPSETLEIFNTKLINVWICTFSPDIIPSIDMDNLLSSGCLSSSRDSDYDVFFYNIYYSGDAENAQSGFTVDNDNDDDETDIVRFSFDVPNEVARDTLYVHVQIEVELTELEGVRRRMLLNIGVDSEANQIQHFGEEIGIKHDKNKQPATPNEEKPNNNNHYGRSLWTTHLSSSWFIGIVLVLILTLNIVFICCKSNCTHSARRGIGFIEGRLKGKRGYFGVKTVDSEYDDSQSEDSQAPMIEARVQ